MSGGRTESTITICTCLYWFSPLFCRGKQRNDDVFDLGLQVVLNELQILFFRCGLRVRIALLPDGLDVTVWDRDGGPDFFRREAFAEHLALLAADDVVRVAGFGRFDVLILTLTSPPIDLGDWGLGRMCRPGRRRRDWFASIPCGWSIRGGRPSWDRV